MKAMILEGLSDMRKQTEVLSLVDIPIPEPQQEEALIKVSVCGVCHTEIDEIEGRAAPPAFPVIPGHQVIGRIEKLPDNDHGFSIGDRVGVAWIYSSCESCRFCQNGMPNLCDQFKATGRDKNGGYAEYMCAHINYIYSIPSVFNDEEAAPLLCAGAIGYRSIALAQMKNGENLGLTGFGASGHQVLKMAHFMYPESKVYVFARSESERKFALDLGAVWVGGTTEHPPEKLKAIIDTTPAWKPVMEALKHLEKGGRLIINAIRKEDIDKEELLSLSYADQLWMEKEIKSVANITPEDVKEFLNLAEKMEMKVEYQSYPLEQANLALSEMKSGNIRGAKVLKLN